MCGLVHTDIRHLRGTHLVDPEFGWSAEEIRGLVQASTSFAHFCEIFFARPLARHGKTQWAEKTPANILQWRRFAEHFTDAVIVHMVRSPYDTVCSLVHRGMSVYEAAAVWLIYTAHGVSAMQHPGYVEIRYERFARDPESELARTLLHRLGLTFSDAMHRTGNPEMTTPGTMTGWRSDERDAVSVKSVGRFDDESESMQNRIVHALSQMRIAERYAKAEGLTNMRVSELCDILGYPYIDACTEDISLMRTLQGERRKVKRELLMRGGAMPWSHPVNMNH